MWLGLVGDEAESWLAGWANEIGEFVGYFFREVVWDFDETFEHRLWSDGNGVTFVLVERNVDY